MKKHNLFIAFFLGCSLGSILSAQTNAEWLTQSIAKADLVVEGKILEQTAFRQDGANEIFTGHRIEVQLHEIGHAIGLKHSIDTDLTTNTKDDDRLMFFTLNSSEKKRVIDGKTKNGVVELVKRVKESLKSTGADCYRSTDGYLFEDNIDGCVTNTKGNVKNNEYSLFPSLLSQGQMLVLETSVNFPTTLVLVDMLGRVSNPKYERTNNGFQVYTNGLPQGFYYLGLHSADGFATFPFRIN